MSEERKRNIEISVERNPHYVSAPVTGALGGPTPNGNALAVHFYYDAGTMPSLINIEIDEQGRGRESEGRAVSRGDITRQVQATFVMTPADALNIGQWLVRHAAEMMGLGPDDLKNLLGQ